MVLTQKQILTSATQQGTRDRTSDDRTAAMSRGTAWRPKKPRKRCHLLPCQSSAVTKDTKAHKQWGSTLALQRKGLPAAVCHHPGPNPMSGTPVPRVCSAGSMSNRPSSQFPLNQPRLRAAIAASITMKRNFCKQTTTWHATLGSSFCNETLPWFAMYKMHVNDSNSGDI